MKFTSTWAEMLDIFVFVNVKGACNLQRKEGARKTVVRSFSFVLSFDVNFRKVLPVPKVT